MWRWYLVARSIGRQQWQVGQQQQSLSSRNARAAPRLRRIMPGIVVRSRRSGRPEDCVTRRAKIVIVSGAGCEGVAGARLRLEMRTMRICSSGARRPVKSRTIRAEGGHEHVGAWGGTEADPADGGGARCCGPRIPQTHLRTQSTHTRYPDSTLLLVSSALSGDHNRQYPLAEESARPIEGGQQ